MDWTTLYLWYLGTGAACAVALLGYAWWLGDLGDMVLTAWSLDEALFNAMLIVGSAVLVIFTWPMCVVLLGVISVASYFTQPAHARRQRYGQWW